MTTREPDAHTNRNHFNRRRAPARRAVSSRRDLVSGALLDCRPRALRAAVLLRLHGQGVRLVAHAGHVRQHDKQAHRRAALRLYRGLDGRPLRPAPFDARRHPDGGHGAHRSRQHDGAVDVLSLLSLQRARLRLRRAAAEPSAARALVRQITRQGDGLRLPRHRRRRRARAAPLGVAGA